jgi:biopolymer transport protein TolR
MSSRKAPLNSHGTAVWSPIHAARRRRDKRRAAYFATINLCGFLTVMLVLLALFAMDIGTTPVNPMNVVDLPFTSHAVWEPGVLRRNAILVWVDRSGAIYVGNTRVSLEDLANSITTSLHNGAEKKIYLGTDKRANYRLVAPVLEQIQLAGVSNVALLTNKSTNPTH